jgi:transcriptional regulator GlxA family with amidase domain
LSPTGASHTGTHAAVDDIGKPLTFCFLLVDDLSMMSLSSAIEPLRSANRLLGRKAFEWRLCSVDGQPVTASNEIVLAAQPLDKALAGANALFICGGMRIDPSKEKPYVVALRTAAHRRLTVGALSTGTHFLARAGLLDGYRCTIHWENSAALSEDFPSIQVTEKIYEIDRDRMTCSGGTAAMDMMLRIIADRHGRELANRVANQFYHQRIRNQDEEQQGAHVQQVNALPESLAKAIHLMRRNLENPIRMDTLAAQLKTSPRQLERHFRRFFGTTPTRYYLKLRVERARELLIYTDQPITDIALGVGFSSTSHLANWFRQFQTKRPSDFRAQSRDQAWRKTGSPTPDEPSF